MIRLVFVCLACALVSACGDGRGSPYSSARASSQPVSYIPILPGTASVPPRAGAVLDGPVAITPGAVPVDVSAEIPNAAVLTAPIAVTPGAVPVAVPDAGVVQSARARASSQAVSASLRPRLAPRAGAVAVAPVRAPVAAAAVPAAVVPVAAKPVAAAAVAPRSARFAKGPIFNACRQSGRKQASKARCGCVQWVANKSLSSAHQSRGAKYFRNQHGVQEARQSDRASDERFWKAWKAFGAQAGRQCKAT